MNHTSIDILHYHICSNYSIINVVNNKLAVFWKSDHWEKVRTELTVATASDRRNSCGDSIVKYATFMER